MAALALGAGLTAVSWSSGAWAQQDWTKVEVKRAIRQDVSPALRDIKVTPKARLDQPRAKRIRPIPLPREMSALLGPDRALQSEVEPLAGATDLLNFAGVGQGDYDYSPQYAPPDTVGAIGKTQYVQWVNVDFMVFRKSTGKKLLGPLPGNAIWQGFGGGCENNNDGDPLVHYDRIADRWVISQFAVGSLPYLECVAVSQTSDATGAYYRYAFDYGNLEFPDYPKMGTWPNGYYMTYNIFSGGQFFAGSKVCAFDRAAMLTGAAATQQCVQLSNAFGGLLPADLDGKTLPPRRAPNYLLSLGRTNTSLDMWKFQVNWSDPSKTALTGPTAVPVPKYSPACGGGTCIPQKGTTNQLDTLADRLMNRLVYRNFGDHEALVVNHSVNGGGRVGVRWYEFRNPGGAIALHQSGTFAPADGLYRWMGSIAMDKVGNIAAGYSTSSGADFPSIARAGRTPGQQLGKLFSEQVIRPGGGSQTGTLHRWGDYSALTIDPVDDCTFWFTTEYLKNSGTFNWSTRIASFKFPSCS
jgi:hypothetical protein